MVLSAVDVQRKTFITELVQSGPDEPLELRLLDVEQIRFSTRFRGYDAAEVDAFREKVRKTMSQYERRSARVDGRLRDAERRLRSLSEDE